MCIKDVYAFLLKVMLVVHLHFITTFAEGN